VIGRDWLIPFSAGVLMGLVLGLVYFGGLWWTSRRIVSASGSPMLPALSLFGRLAVLAVALGLMADIQPFMLVGSLPGLVAARMLWIRSVTESEPAAPVSALDLGRREDRHG
jgi:F1F0 ATPase subunit 2